MKKFSLIVLLAAASSFAGAQSIDDIKTFAYLNQTQKGKEAVDKFLSVEKNAKKPDGWYYKGYIYNMASKDSSKTLAESIALKDEAFKALKKYREMDPKGTLLEEQNNSPLFDLYVGYSTDIGVKAYEKKDLATSHEGFKKALDVHDYVFEKNLAGANGFKFSALDTTLVLYAAITAMEQKKTDDAVAFYKKMVDANVGGPSYIDAYQVLADYYKNKKDKAAFTDIIAKGRKQYPANEEYWTALEIEEATEGVGKPAVFPKYEELIASHPGNYVLAYNYGVELYQYMYSDSAKGVDMAPYKAKFVDAMKAAIAAKSTVEANFLLANFLYNNSIDISDEARKIKGVKPDDLKKKKEMQAASTKSMDDAIPYALAAETAFDSIAKPKGTEKANHRQALIILRNIYEIKKDAAKLAEYEKKVKEAE